MTALRASGDDFRGGYQWGAGVTGCRQAPGGTKLATQATRLTIVRPCGAWRAPWAGAPPPAGFPPCVAQ